jgi:hypothetical protein
VIVVEILIETVPFSLIMVLETVLLADMIVTFVVAGAYVWTHRGKELGENERIAGNLWVGVVVALLYLVSVPVVFGIHAANTERHALNSSDYSSYGVYEGTVERATLTDYTVRTDYGAVLTIPYSMGWVGGHVDTGDRVALDVSRMTLGKNQSIIMRSGDDMGVMLLQDDACVSRFDPRGARVLNGVACHRAFGDTEYKGSVLLGGGGTYYVLTGVSRL